LNRAHWANEQVDEADGSKYCVKRSLHCHANNGTHLFCMLQKEITRALRSLVDLQKLVPGEEEFGTRRPANSFDSSPLVSSPFISSQCVVRRVRVHFVRGGVA
jgi:hypothetical protein